MDGGNVEIGKMYLLRKNKSSNLKSISKTNLNSFLKFNFFKKHLNKKSTYNSNNT